MVKNECGFYMFFKNEPFNPWERKPRENGKRPDTNNLGNPIDDIFDRVTSFIKDKGKKSGRGPSGGGKGVPNQIPPKFLIIAGVIGVGLWLLSGFYKVEEGSVGVVLRFGELVRMSSSGLQYHLPSPIEQVIVQNITSVNRIDGNLKNDGDEASEKTLILTADENMIHTNFTVLWKIKHVNEFLFSARDPISTIRAAAESCVREVIGQTLARLVLTEGRDVIEKKTQDLLQKLMDEYKLGITIFNVQLQKVEAPAQVIEAFYAVQSSLVDASRLENEAEAFRNDIIPRTRGEAVQYIEEAKAESAQKINYAKGQAGRFKVILAAYRQNPMIAKKRYYLEAISHILIKTKGKIVFDRNAQQGIVPYLPLDKLQRIAEKTQAPLEVKENEKKANTP